MTSGLALLTYGSVRQKLNRASSVQFSYVALYASLHASASVSAAPSDALAVRVEGGRRVAARSSTFSRRELVVRRRPTAPRTTANEALERGTEIRLENRVEDRINGRVGVAEPEEDGVESASDSTRRAPAVDHVQHEEPQPRATQYSHDDRRSDGRPRLQMFGVTRPSLPMHM